MIARLRGTIHGYLLDIPDSQETVEQLLEATGFNMADADGVLGGDGHYWLDKSWEKGPDGNSSAEPSPLPDGELILPVRARVGDDEMCLRFGICQGEGGGFNVDIAHSDGNIVVNVSREGHSGWRTYTITSQGLLDAIFEADATKLKELQEKG